MEGLHTWLIIIIIIIKEFILTMIVQCSRVCLFGNVSSLLSKNGILSEGACLFLVRIDSSLTLVMLQLILIFGKKYSQSPCFHTYVTFDL